MVITIRTIIYFLSGGILWAAVFVTPLWWVSQLEDRRTYLEPYLQWEDQRVLFALGWLVFGIVFLVAIVLEVAV